MADLVAEKAWPASGKKLLNGQPVLLGITWRPAPGDGLNGAFTQFHISDIWMDDAAIQNAAYFQTETHKVFIRSRWMPAFVDAVESAAGKSATDARRQLLRRIQQAETEVAVDHFLNS